MVQQLLKAIVMRMNSTFVTEYPEHRVLNGARVFGRYATVS